MKFINMNNNLESNLSFFPMFKKNCEKRCNLPNNLLKSGTMGFKWKISIVSFADVCSDTIVNILK